MPLLELCNVGKSFSGVTVLKGLSFALSPGECLGVVGENGAGKSTLMKILCGVWPSGSFDGQFSLLDQACLFNSPRDALDRGIFIIHQELSVFENLSLVENLFMGRFPTAKGVIDWALVETKTEEILASLSLSHLDPKQNLSTLRTGEKQMVEIARALMTEAKIMIFDEPTSALTEKEIATLYRVIDDLKKKGIACLLISHKLDEVRRLCGRVIILRDGELVAIRDLSETSDEDLVREMVGRKIEDVFPPKPPTESSQEVVLEVKNLAYKPGPSGRPLLRNLNLKLHRGEILGIAGLMGAGRTELVMAIFGALKAEKISGQVFLFGKEVDIQKPDDAINNGLGLVTEDRKLTGACLHLSVSENLVLPNLEMISKLKLINRDQENEMVDKNILALKIRTRGGAQPIRTLSGGNQQKVLLARWLARGVKILILDEPTRGIDVGAKAEIYRLLRDLAKTGVSILMVSSELPEILGMSDRVMVMREGIFAGELNRFEMNSEAVIKFAAGVG